MCCSDNLAACQQALYDARAGPKKFPKCEPSGVSLEMFGPVLDIWALATSGMFLKAFTEGKLAPRHAALLKARGASVLMTPRNGDSTEGYVLLRGTMASAGSHQFLQTRIESAYGR